MFCQFLGEFISGRIHAGPEFTPAPNTGKYSWQSIHVLVSCQGVLGGVSDVSCWFKLRKKLLGCRIRSAGIGLFWGEKFVAQSLQVHLLFPVRCLACVILQVAKEIVLQSKPQSQRVLSGNAGKNRTAHAQLGPIILVPLNKLLSSVLGCPTLLPPISFQGPGLQPEKYFRGPESVTKFFRDRRESK